MIARLPRRIAKLLRERDEEITKVKIEYDGIIALALEELTSKVPRSTKRKTKKAAKKGRPVLPADPDKPWRKATKATLGGNR